MRPRERLALVRLALLVRVAVEVADEPAALLLLDHRGGPTASRPHEDRRAAVPRRRRRRRPRRGGCVPSDVGHAGVSGRKAVGSSFRFLPFSFLGGIVICQFYTEDGYAAAVSAATLQRLALRGRYQHKSRYQRPSKKCRVESNFTIQLSHKNVPS